MTDFFVLSRPARMASRMTNTSEAEMHHLFRRKRILIRLEERFASLSDPRETFLLAVNQCLRFCPNVAVYVPGLAASLLNRCKMLSHGTHGSGGNLASVRSDDTAGFDAILSVGTRVRSCGHWITVNSGGWVARLAASDSGVDELFWEKHPSNPIGAIAAACLGSAGVFLRIIETGAPRAGEFSLFSHETAQPGALYVGPELPNSPIALTTFLVGCGAVANGWAYTIRRLPVTGEVQAIDGQSIQLENLGSYVTADRSWLKRPKVELMRALLFPAIRVTERPDEWEFFKIRVEHGLTVPNIIVNGLDNVATRHSVQRLWPDVLIDMAAGGLTSQVIVSQPRRGGLCLLHGLHRPPNELTWAERLSRDTGLPIERILNEPTTPITQQDIESAPPEKRPDLERARGRLICGHITQRNREMEGFDDDFAPAVPFVTTWSGAVGAAETMKYLMGHRHVSSLHYQKSFESGRLRGLGMTCTSNCECRQLTPKSSGLKGP